MKTEQEEIWGNQAEKWKKLFYELNGNFLLEWLLKLAKKSDKILDQGCGVGQYAFTIYSLGFKNVTGMDFSEKLLRIAKNNAKKLKYKVRFVKGDIRKMPFKKESFDIVFSAGIIEHVPETDKALSELSRVLKKRGYLFIHVPHKISTFTLAKKIQQFLSVWKLGYEKSFSIFELSELLHQNGFRILDMRINEFQPGKHKILGKIIQIVDKPLFKMGLGGHHLSFVCRKIR